LSLRGDVNSADLTVKETPKQFKANARRDMCSYVCVFVLWNLISPAKREAAKSALI